MGWTLENDGFATYCFLLVGVSCVFVTSVVSDVADYLDTLVVVLFLVCRFDILIRIQRII